MLVATACKGRYQIRRRELAIAVAVIALFVVRPLLSPPAGGPPLLVADDPVAGGDVIDMAPATSSLEPGADEDSDSGFDAGFDGGFDAGFDAGPP